MPKPANVLFLLAALSSSTLLYAQSPDPAGPPQPAPIQHAYAPQRPQTIAATITTAQPLVTANNIATAQPTPGIYLRVAPHSSVTATTITADTTELRIDRGLANISVHRPSNAPEILIDLPGGQTALLKDGLYTFNAATNTVRVLKGEAAALPPNQKRIKVKEDHALAFTGATLKSIEFYPSDARADLIPYNPRPEGPNYGGPRYGAGYPGPYGDGFYGYGDGYGYPYYAYGYPYGFYGYPFGIGLGFGYYGGFGGFRGGFGGFGGGFHGHR